MSLIAQSDLEKKIGRTLNADEQSLFPTLNTAIQSYVERRLGTSVESETESTRYYDGGVQNLQIDPCTDLTAVKYVDSDSDLIETLLTTEYTSEPVNRTLKTMVRNRYGRFISGMNVVGVTAIFSTYADEDVRAITKSAILDMLAQTMENQEIVSKESIEGYTVEYTAFKETTAMNALKTIVQGII